MFDSIEARLHIAKVIGWNDHYDLTEIPALSAALKESESGEYYQEKHPAMRLDLIEATLPNNRDLEEYLVEKEDAAITELLNDITTGKEVSKVAKELVTNDVIYDSKGWVNDTIINEGRFVGIRFKPVLDIGLKATINRVALQLTEAQPDLKLYLYHSKRAKKLAEIAYSTTQGNQFNWIETNIEMKADDQNLSGGYFYLGYYQDDLAGQAIEYTKLNWRTGFCGTCDAGVNQRRYTAIAAYVNMQSFYVPAPSLPADKEDMFDPEAIISSEETNWGFNLNISVKCDLTSFFIDNRLALRKALSLKLVLLVLRDIQFSQQINHVEEQLKMMIIRDLEGDKETNYINIPQQYKRALKAVRLNFSSINGSCLPCDINSGVTYDTM